VIIGQLFLSRTQWLINILCMCVGGAIGFDDPPPAVFAIFSGFLI
jgi:hypothetical protein